MEENQKLIKQEKAKEGISKEQTLEENLKEIYGENLKEINYIENISLPSLGKFGLELQKITIVTIEEDGKTLYELYNENGIHIGTMDEEYNIIYDQKYLQILEQEMPEYFKMLALETNIPLQYKVPEDEKENKIKLLKEEKKQEVKKTDKKQTKENIAKAMNIKPEEIKSYIELDANSKITKNETMKTIIPGAEACSKIIIVADKNNKFSFMGLRKNEKGEKEAVKLDSGLKQTQGTNPTQNISSINRDGSNIEEKQVSCMYRANNKSKNEDGFSVRIGEYGNIEVSYYRRTSENEYMQIPIETKLQRHTTKEVKDKMDKTKNKNLNDEYDKYKQNQELGIEKQTLAQISDDIELEEIYLENGEVTTFEEEAKKAKVSVREFKEKFKNAEGNTADQKLENTHQEIEEEYMLSSRQKR